MTDAPAFIQGCFTATGQGLDRPVPLDPRATYRVPADKRAQTIYFRAGNAAGELIALVLMRRGSPMRYFAVGAKQAIHVPLAVLEDLSPMTEVEVLIGAPAGLSVAVVLDIGFMEVS